MDRYAWTLPCAACFSSSQQRLKKHDALQCSPAAMVVEQADEDLGSADTARRNIVAKGMSRFEGIAKHPPKQPGVEYISDRVISILGYNRDGNFTLNGTNCYLVGTGKDRILIDTAYGNGTEEGFERFMQNLDAVLEENDCRISQMLITHAHPDHYGGCERINLKYGPGIPMAMFDSPDMEEWWTLTIDLLKDRGLYQQIMDGPQPFDIDFGAVGKDWEAAMDNLVFHDSEHPDGGAEIASWPDDDDVSWDPFGRSKNWLIYDLSYYHKNQSVLDVTSRVLTRWNDPEDLSMPAVLLKEGDIIKVEGATLKVWHAPGHAMNHAAFVLEEENNLFSGDHVLGFGTTVLLDLYDYMNTLERMVLFKPNRLYPGHGPHIKDGTALVSRYRAHRQAREDQVVQLMQTTVVSRKKTAVGSDTQWRQPTTKTITTFLYSQTSESRLKMACENIEKILVKLWLEGKVDAVKGTGRSEMAFDMQGRRYRDGPAQYDEEVRWVWRGQGGGGRPLKL